MPKFEINFYHSLHKGNRSQIFYNLSLLTCRPPLMPKSTLWRDPFPDWESRSTIWPALTTISMASRLDWLRRISIFSTRCRNWTLPMPASPKPNLNFKSKSMTWRETWMTRAGYERLLEFFVFSLQLQAGSTIAALILVVVSRIKYSFTATPEPASSAQRPPEWLRQLERPLWGRIWSRLQPPCHTQPCQRRVRRPQD